MTPDQASSILYRLSEVSEEDRRPSSTTSKAHFQDQSRVEKDAKGRGVDVDEASWLSTLFGKNGEKMRGPPEEIS